MKLVRLSILLLALVALILVGCEVPTTGQAVASKGGQPVSKCSLQANCQDLGKLKTDVAALKTKDTELDTKIDNQVSSLKSLLSSRIDQLEAKVNTCNSQCNSAPTPAPAGQQNVTCESDSGCSAGYKCNRLDGVCEQRDLSNLLYMCNTPSTENDCVTSAILYYQAQNLCPTDPATITKKSCELKEGNPQYYSCLFSAVCS